MARTPNGAEWRWWGESEEWRGWGESEEWRGWGESEEWRVWDERPVPAQQTWPKDGAADETS